MPVLDSQAAADVFLDWVRQEKASLGFTPRLAAILNRPTADAASIEYRDLILKDAARLGLEAEALESSDEGELFELIRRANGDSGIHGIIVLYPLRCKISDEDVMDLVSPYKDPEGLHSINLGYLIKFKQYLDEKRQVKCVVPATPKAVVKALQRYPEIKIDGAFVTIVNNSMRVGKPLGLMLENLGATVVKCYHKTRPADLEACVRRADILVTAVPDPKFRIDASWVKPGAAVLDVSYEGNIGPAGLSERAGLWTVPENRLGKVTRAMMFVNLVYCARYKGVFYD
ncbi:MAG: bifunctional 5,10-methylenetetrahydrofolate dehydrogenase/5,10-methenyltetrahydrofolate cyclohydrolase [Elusimicrobia bacterium]|nr:bifunctional 5,10-methylenetetrahydrofolate dehydrogenase/5,10-methenyltetrahydrofolate cyclohydrolase [Elusimicrobiota bacterium]